MPARIARHPHGEPDAPDGCRERGVLADAGGHGVDPADPLQVGAAQQHGLADADPVAKAIGRDQPARPAAIEEGGFKFAAKAPRLGRDRHSGQEPDPRRQLPGEAAELIRAQPGVDVAGQHELMSSPAPSPAQIVELGVGRGRRRVGRQPCRHVRMADIDPLDQRDGGIVGVGHRELDLEFGGNPVLRAALPYWRQSPDRRP